MHLISLPRPFGSYWWLHGLSQGWMKNKADLDPIYGADLLKSRKIIDILFHSDEL